MQRDVQTYPAIVVLYLRRLYRGPVWLAWPTSVHDLYRGLWRCRKSRGSGGKGVCIGKWNYLRKMDAFVYFYIIIWTIWWSFGHWSCRLLYAAVVPSRKLVTQGSTADYNSWSEEREQQIKRIATNLWSTNCKQKVCCLLFGSVGGWRTSRKKTARTERAGLYTRKPHADSHTCVIYTNAVTTAADKRLA